MNICDNCIHKKVCEWIPNFDTECTDYLTEIPHGNWLPTHDECAEFKCSVCNNPNFWKDNFCPNCGADMRGDKT